MPSEAKVIRIDALGRNDQAAIRVVLNIFVVHGWTDRSGAAIALVTALADKPSGLTTSRLSRELPDSFIVQNKTSRAAVKRALDPLSNSAVSS